jgi:MFS family permease
MRQSLSQYFSRFGKLPRNVLVLSLVSFINDTSSEMIYPLLPTFLALTLGASPVAIGLIEGFAETTASLFKLYSGYLSDKFRRRKALVVFGYGLSSIVRPLLALVTSWQQVFLVRMTDRVGKGFRSSPRDALLAADIDHSQRGLAYGFHRASDNLGAVIGPVFASLLIILIAADRYEPTADEYKQLFLFASIPVIVGLIVLVIFVKEDGRREIEEIRKAAPIKFSLAGFDANFRRFLVVISLFTLSNSTDAFLLLRAQSVGIAPPLLPIIWMFLHISKVLSSIIFGDLSDRIGRKPLIFSGWILYALVYLAFAFVQAPWQVWSLFILYGIFFGLTEGTEKALVADLVADEKRGTAFGLYNLAFGITVFPASLIFGAVWTYFGVVTAFVVSAVISIIAALLFLTIDTRRRV